MDLACQIELNRCMPLSAEPGEIHGPYVYYKRTEALTDPPDTGEFRFYCNNDAPQDLYRDTSRMMASGLLKTTYSYFRCWTMGTPHTRGSLWYFTHADIPRGEPGYLPADKVHAPSEFEADPAAFGFMRCP